MLKKISGLSIRITTNAPPQKKKEKKRRKEEKMQKYIYYISFSIYSLQEGVSTLQLTYYITSEKYHSTNSEAQWQFQLPWMSPFHEGR